jgi:hypothetical protein
MYQLEVSKFAAAHWQDIAIGAIILVAAIGGVVPHSLTNCLKHYDASAWEALGRPQLFSGKSTKEELTYFWYILARQYRKSEISKIRALSPARYKRREIAPMMQNAGSSDLSLGRKTTAIVACNWTRQDRPPAQWKMSPRAAAKIGNTPFVVSFSAGLSGLRADPGS